MSLEISFKCCSCGQPNAPVQRPDWAKLWGFESCHLWLESTVPLPGDPIPQLDQLPKARDRRLLIVSHPFRAESDTPFWLHFMRALSSANGWDDNPEELRDSGLVYCRLTADLGPWGDSGRAIEVEVLDSFFTSAAAQRFAPVKSGKLKEIYSSGRVSAKCEDMHYLSWNGEGDIGAWFVFQRLSYGWAAIIYGEWDFHQNYVYAGHRPLTAAECVAYGLAGA